MLQHLFKLEASPAADPRAGWRTTTLDAREQIGFILEDSPSLRPGVGDWIAEQIDLAAMLAEADLSQYGEPAEAVRARLEKGGFTAEQVLGNWFPDPPA